MDKKLLGTALDFQQYIYRKYPNLVRTQIEMISDTNYLVHTVSES